ncbi:Dor1-domain-containing protein [Vararia minispora EC-137]|uniref:Dor1-domain-containing protein n=1 Tax=Vararia minispora EC-137 TaxID=1314806 RepID=A0ACB8QPZ9_9AGAM|nr:Dor1-domain-containing protein [Vararia minispora EC-137]
MSALAEVLVRPGEPSKLDLTSAGATAYLNHLTSLHLPQLLAEPTNLSSTSSQLTNALTNLCTTSYPTFLSLHTTTADLTSTLSSFSGTLDGLLCDIPDLETSARALSSEITSVQSERRRAALVLEHSAKLQDVLELPLLAETCVRNGFFQEALDLAAHAASLAARFPTLPVVQDIHAEVDGAVRILLAQLLSMLREPAKLPVLFKAVNFLRRMQVLSEEQLALAFLTGRLETLDIALDAIALEKKGIEREREKEAWVRYMKRFVDAWREGVHDVVTQYTAIFLERHPTGDGSSCFEALQALLPAFSVHLLARLLTALKEALPHIPDPTALTSLLTQLTYCSTSFARVGLDFRLLLPPLFANAVVHAVTREFSTASEAFVGSIKSNQAKAPRLWLVSSASALPLPPDDVLVGLAHSPPGYIASYPPIANLMNALLSTLNSLRLLAPISILPELVRSLDDALVISTCAFLDYARAPTSREEDTRTVLRASGTVFVRAFVPFMRRALAEGVYGISVDAAEAKMNPRLKEVMQELNVRLEE